MKRTPGFIFLVMYSLVFCMLSTVSCNDESATGRYGYSTAPVFDRELVITDGPDTLQPVSVHFYDDTLFISYLKLNQIDIFSTDLEKIHTIVLDEPHRTQPTFFAVADSEIVISDNVKGIVAVYDRAGSYKTSFAMLPDMQTGLAPFALDYFENILYLADIGMNKVLAISMTDIPGLMEQGELILLIPADTSVHIGFPSSVLVTPDGRLLIGDGDSGKINAFTCDGRWIYEFDRIEADKAPAPQSIALDNIIDSALQDTSSFDPSGIRKMGRIHIADVNNGAVHMFNPLGKFISSYGNSRLKNPTGITIDKESRRIFIADPKAGCVFIFGYGD